MSSGRVLTLDDEAQIRRVLRTTLVASGFVVREARSGEEALEMVREEMPDLLIIDINLPGMSGFEVCREYANPATSPSSCSRCATTNATRCGRWMPAPTIMWSNLSGFRNSSPGFAPIC